MKFPVDERLSPELAGFACERACEESAHVTWLGLAGAGDWTITRRAVEDGFVLVTSNRRDFVELYGREAHHSGLLCLNAERGTLKAGQRWCCSPWR